MSKIFNLLIMVAMISLFAEVGKAEAAAAHRGTDGTFGGALTVVANDLGIGSNAGYFIPSAGVQVAYHTSNGGDHFASVTQHKRGNSQYVMHSSGGSPYSATVTPGSWGTLADAYVPTATPGGGLNAAYTVQ
ncbi:MAG: hypothetical protein KKC21_07215 [Nitrospinae bacterium]|nr:hypothetical protein [Nitrospinota bacterium]